ncbi:hypothetical protein Tco_1523443 [Tanacetum coccineum]
MLAIPNHSQVLSMAMIDSKEAQQKLKAGICFRIASHKKVTKGITLTLALKSTRALPKQTSLIRAVVDESFWVFFFFSVWFVNIKSTVLAVLDTAYRLDSIRRIELSSALWSLIRLNLDPSGLVQLSSRGLSAVSLMRIAGPLFSHATWQHEWRGFFLNTHALIQLVGVDEKGVTCLGDAVVLTCEYCIDIGDNLDMGVDEIRFHTSRLQCASALAGLMCIQHTHVEHVETAYYDDVDVARRSSTESVRFVREICSLELIYGTSNGVELVLGVEGGWWALGEYGDGLYVGLYHIECVSSRFMSHRRQDRWETQLGIWGLVDTRECLDFYVDTLLGGFEWRMVDGVGSGVVHEERVG